MKAGIAFVFALFLLSAVHADVIALWDFNSTTPDNDRSTGTTNPAVGLGSASLVGAVVASFSDGSTNDPAPSSDDSGWSTTHYPAAGTSNKLAGVQFNVSTLGYSNIVVHWDQRVSTTGSKYYRLQFTDDGLHFTDATPPIAIQAGAASSTYYEAQTNSLSHIAAVNDNPNFAFRIVSEFENTAVGGPAITYVTPFGTNRYSTAGTVRFDRVTVSGTPIPGANTPPLISHVEGVTLRVNQTSGPIPVTVMDAEDPAASLVLSAESSDAGVIPPAAIVFGGSGANRTVRITSGAQMGATVVTLWVTDTGGRSNSTTFSAQVLPANLPPWISGLHPTNTLVDMPAPPMSFLIGDSESAPGDLVLFGSSSNLFLLSDQNIVFGGSGSNRTVTVLPNPGRSGIVPVAVSVSDGVLTTVATFAVVVNPSTQVLLHEPFDYPDGSLLTNSGFLWNNRSGAMGEMLVTNGQLLVSAAQTEDVAVRLPGASFAPGAGIKLYCAAKLKFLSLPKSAPDYFAHFVGGATLRARLFAGTTNAAPGCFRLFMANGSDTKAEWPADLVTNTSYTVVIRHDIDSASSTFWVNPTSESNPGVTASDVQTPVALTSFGFRQGTGLGAALLVDEVRIAKTFEALTTDETATLKPIPLSVQRLGNQIALSWTNPAFNLQSASTTAGPFTNLPGAASPYLLIPSNPSKFYRLHAN